MEIKDKIKKFKSAIDNITSQYLVENIKNNMIKKDVWFSSAQRLENALKNHGIVLPQKLYYEYKFPGGLKNFEFHEQNITLTGFYNIYRSYFLNPDWGFRKYKSLKGFMFDLYWWDYKQNKKTDLSAFFGFCISLAVSDVEKLESAFIAAQEQVYKLADLIKEINPELQSIKNHRSVDFFFFLIYGFAPQEIQFFLNLGEKRKARGFDLQYEIEGKDEELNHIHKNSRIIEEFVGFRKYQISYFLAPETSDKIVKAIYEHKMLMQKQHTME